MLTTLLAVSTGTLLGGLISGSIWGFSKKRKLISPDDDTFIREKYAKKIIKYIDSRTPFAVILIDLDRFKDVSNTVGFVERRLLISEMYRRLKSVDKKSTFDGLLRGKEYVSIIPNMTPSEMNEITKKMLSCFKKAFNTKSYSISLTASIGWCFGPDDGDTPSSLLRAANTALGEAKSTGGNSISRYHESMRKRAERKLFIMEDIRRGLRASEFEPWFQPRVSCDKDGGFRVNSAEALARWRKSDGEVIYPNEFIGVAESCGLITELGNMILMKACLKLREWEIEYGEKAPKISVNVSPKQFVGNMPETINRMIQTVGFDPRNLEIEITESSIFVDIEKVQKSLREISAMGVSVAIDDFGTGYSSFPYLQDFPIDVIKIDSLFVKDIETPDHVNKAMIRSIVHIARSMGLGIVIEGVETGEQLSVLQELKAFDELQGYHFARPMEAVDFKKWFVAMNKI